MAAACVVADTNTCRKRLVGSRACSRRSLMLRDSVPAELKATDGEGDGESAKLARGAQRAGPPGGRRFCRVK